jgi:hypothetical protein
VRSILLVTAKGGDYGITGDSAGKRILFYQPLFIETK